MKRMLAMVAAGVAGALLLAGCSTTTDDGGQDADGAAGSAFRTLLASNPSDAFDESAVTLDESVDEACGVVAEQHAALADQTYRVAVSGDSPPLAYVDELSPDRLLGYHPAIAEVALACLGVEFEYVFFDFAGLAPAMEAGRADIQWRPIFASAERAAIMDFVIYQQNHNVKCRVW